MSSSLLAVVVDCRDPRVQAGFWSQVLDRAWVERNTDEFLVSDPAGSATPLYFMRVPEPKVGKNRLHLDLVTDRPLEDEVSRLRALGARLVEVRRDPDGHVRDSFTDGSRAGNARVTASITGGSRDHRSNAPRPPSAADSINRSRSAAVGSTSSARYASNSDEPASKNASVAMLSASLRLRKSSFSRARHAASAAWRSA